MAEENKKEKKRRLKENISKSSSAAHGTDMTNTDLLAQIEEEDANATGFSIHEYRKRVAEKEKQVKDDEKLNRRLARGRN